MPLSDISTATENEVVADCYPESRPWHNPDTRLIGSIAGGCKTMETLLYGCLTLVGREADRLTYVLVHEPFDDPRLSARFYFPGQPAALDS